MGTTTKISRSEAVTLIYDQFDRCTNAHTRKNDRAHYGAQELRELLDAIYGGPPSEASEMLDGIEPHTGMRRCPICRQELGWGIGDVKLLPDLQQVHTACADRAEQAAEVKK